jgi:hypothetical protein
MHAAAVRMCLDAIWGSRIETLSCSGYDHSWVRSYQYEDGSEPLLPRGTILRVTGYYDNTPANRNVVDPRNWSGLGHRSIDNMNILLMQAVTLTDEKFQEEVTARREKLKLKPSEDAGAALANEKIPGQADDDAGPRASAARAPVSRFARPGLWRARRRGCRDRDAGSAAGSGGEGGQQHHAGLRRLGAEPGRFVRADVRLSESRVGRRGVDPAWREQQHGAGRT